MADLHTAVRAVLKRWDSPRWDWNQEGPTADLMAALRAALDAGQAQRSLVRVSSADVERMIAECVPGGSVCDPQQVADAIRRYCNAWPGDAGQAQPVGEVVVTKAGGRIVAVTRQDEEGRILSVIAEADEPQASQPVAPAGWLPIETAPKDGTLFLGWVSALRFGEDDHGQQYQQDVSQVDLCQWRTQPNMDAGWFEALAGRVGDSEEITHWMPLPAAPGAQP